MAKVDDNYFPKLILDPTAASVPSAPTDGSWKIYARANGVFARSSNSIVGPFQVAAGLSDPMTTRGDTIYRNSSNVTDRLAIPAAGQFLGRVGSDLGSAYPPGYEMAYVEFTSNVTINATTEATANSIVSAGSVAFDGSTIVWIEAYIPNFVKNNQPDNGRFWLYDGSSSIGEIGRTTNPQALTVAVGMPITVKRRMTPSNASHTYSVRGSVGNNSATAGAGAGGASTVMPGYIRITRV